MKIKRIQSYVLILIYLSIGFSCAEYNMPDGLDQNNPKPPTLLSPVDFKYKILGNNLVLYWTTYSSAHDGFIIDRCINHGVWEMEYAMLSAERTSFTDSTVELLHDREYEYRICVFAEGKKAEYTTLKFKMFDCGRDLYDPRDGKHYKTVKIGSQCWMAENMNIGYLFVSDSSLHNQTSNGHIEKYCIGNKERNCDIYGGLYQWDEMMQYESEEGARGICPEEWHIPTDDEWKELEMVLGMGAHVTEETGYRGTDEGGKLKTVDDTLWKTPNAGASNVSGFNAKPNGSLWRGGSFQGYTIHATFWTSTQASDKEAIHRRLVWNQSNMSRNKRHKDYGFGVRCIKD